MSEKALCQLCGEPMPEGEEMFNYHGYSGPCPKPPLVSQAAPPPSEKIAKMKRDYDNAHETDLPLYRLLAFDAITMASALEAQIAALTNALAGEGIAEEHERLRWVFKPGKIEVASSGGNAETRLRGVLRQTRYVIDELSRRVEADRDRLLYLLALNGWTAWGLAISAHGSPKGREAFDRIRHPQVGDLVLEVSTVYGWKSKSASPGSALGKLLRIEQEPVSTPEVWEGPEPIPTEQVYYIEPLDGSLAEARWTNARFIALMSESLEVR